MIMHASEPKEMETNQTTGNKIRIFKSLRRLLSRSSSPKIRRKCAKLDDFTLNSIHRQYASTFKLYANMESEDDSGAEISNAAQEEFQVSEQNRPNLDTLPECLLPHLFSYLNAQDVSSLGWCAPNLHKAARCEKKMWQKVHHVCNGSSPHHSLLLPFLNEHTTDLCLSNSTDSSPEAQAESVCFDHIFFDNLRKVPHLTSFTLENHSIDYVNRLNLRCLPKCLTELRLRRINLLGQNGKQCLIFHNVHLNLPNLQEVDVSHCSWVTSQVLYSLSHCDRLKKLALVGCTQIDYTDISVQSATIYGFWKLESLDLRLTGITFEDVSIFKKLTRLKAVLLEKPKACSIDTTKQESKSKKKRGHPWRGSGCSWTRSVENVYTTLESINLSDYLSSRLETLVVRNYPEINDHVLEEIRMYFGSMKYLDLTGTNCTPDNIIGFHDLRPQLRLIY